MVVGGGFIGLEVGPRRARRAWRSPCWKWRSRLLGRVLRRCCRTGSPPLHRGHGVTLCTGAQIDSLVVDGHRRVTGAFGWRRGGARPRAARRRRAAQRRPAQAAGSSLRARHRGRRLRPHGRPGHRRRRRLHCGVGLTARCAAGIGEQGASEGKGGRRRAAGPGTAVHGTLVLVRPVRPQAADGRPIGRRRPVGAARQPSTRPLVLGVALRASADRGRQRRCRQGPPAGAQAASMPARRPRPRRSPTPRSTPPRCSFSLSRRRSLPPAPHPGAPAPAGIIHAMRVLLVEDDTMIGESSDEALRRQGNGLRLGAICRAAEAVLGSERFDAVLFRPRPAAARRPSRVLKGLRGRGDATPVIADRARHAARQGQGPGHRRRRLPVSPFELRRAARAVAARRRRQDGCGSLLLQVVDLDARSATMR